MIIGLDESHTWGISGSVDHLTARSVDPPGVLVLTRHWDAGDSWLTVKRADPEVRFTHELLEEFAAGGDIGSWGDVLLEWRAPGHSCEHCDSYVPVCFTDCLLHIYARDRHIIYRICEFVPDSGLGRWIARWPD